MECALVVQAVAVAELGTAVVEVEQLKEAILGARF
jgi:hypothetical protein